MTSKQPRRSNLKSDKKFVAQTTDANMFILAVLTFFCSLIEHNLSLLDRSALP